MSAAKLSCPPLTTPPSLPPSPPQELSTIMSAAKLRGVLVAFLGATPSIVSMVTLWAYISLGNTLSASK